MWVLWNDVFSCRCEIDSVSLVGLWLSAPPLRPRSRSARWGLEDNCVKRRSYGSMWQSPFISLHLSLSLSHHRSFNSKKNKELYSYNQVLWFFQSWLYNSYFQGTRFYLESFPRKTLRNKVVITRFVDLIKAFGLWRILLEEKKKKKRKKKLRCLLNLLTMITLFH